MESLLIKIITPFLRATPSSTRNISHNIKPVAVYDNADTNKATIFAENRGKSGIYRWVNKINNNTYIGSSNNISVRMYKYFDLSYLAKSNRLIERALLKYGFSNFTLEILEYCDKSNQIEREQYYLDKCNPAYNIVTKAGSTLGYKHTEESIEKMRNFILSDEALDKKRQSTANATASRKIKVTIEDIETKKVSEYNSLSDAGRAIGVSRAAVSQASLKNNLIKNKYRVIINKKEL